MKKRFFAALASLCVMMSALPMVAFAEGDSGTPLVPSTLVPSTQAGSALCEHHPSHDEACGYTEGTVEIPCAHEHDEDCYTLVTECVHEHTTECYPAESVSENTATPSEAEEAEPTACTHVCTEESGCITKALDCKHEHDEACGYVPATEGTPCTFACEVCNPQDSGDTATPSDAQPEECTCETLCTGDNINEDCPVCGAEDANLNKCKGLEALPATLSNALPVTALAAEGVPSQLYVGNKQVISYTETTYWTTDTDGNLTQTAADQSWNVKYDPATVALTLRGATIQGADNTGSPPYGAGIYALCSQDQPVALTIELIGTNTITGYYGIFLNAEISADSNGTDASLTITGENNGSLEVSGSYHGIFVKSGTGNASVTIENASVDAKTTQTSSGYAGVNVQSSANATGSPNISLSVDGGSLTASGTGNSDGILFYVGSSQATGATTSLTVSDHAIVDARNGGISALKILERLPTPTPTGDNRSGIVFDGSTGTVYGNVTLDESLTINQGETLTVPDGSKLDCNEKLTNNGTINVESGGTVSGSLNDGTTITTPSISQQPQSTTVTEGQDATFTVEASAGSETPTYQWQQKTTESDSSWTDISGAATASYTIEATTTDMSGTQYRCVVTASGVSVISAPATLTVNEPVTYAITVHGSAGGTATADKTAAAAGEIITLTATPASGYHFDGWSVVSGTVTIQNNQFIMPAENVEIQAVFDRNSSSVGSGGSSYRDREYEFWMDVKEQIRDADPGDTIKVNARSYDRMPWSVMEALRSADGVTLHITWNGGEDIIIPSAAALSEQSRVYYPLSYLEDMTFEVESEAPAADPDKVNPETGGILEVTAPAVTTPAGEPEVTAPQRGLAETPELAEEGVEQPLPGVYEPEETVTTSTTEESGTSGLWIAGVVAVLAAAGGFWFWKQRESRS